MDFILLLFVAVAFIIGSATTFYLMRQPLVRAGADAATMLLIEEGFVRSRTKANGDVEILPLTYIEEDDLEDGVIED